MGPQIARQRREDIDAKAEEVIRHFNPSALERLESPLYKVVAGLKQRYEVPIHFEQDLGYAAGGKKILGRFDFEPRQILIDKVLPYDAPRFRWTLAHEVGHFVLHRKLNPQTICRDGPNLVDTREQLRFFRTANWSELQWIEWQANQFASALLLPRIIVVAGVVEVQRRLGVRRPGTIYLDDQPCNLRDYISIVQHLAKVFGVSQKVLEIRLINLGILNDARPGSRARVQDVLDDLFSEDDALEDSPVGGKVS